jgi:ATP-dependent Clp protease adapter protein ClpS
LDSKQYTGTEHTNVACYEFLVTVQAALLEHVPASIFRTNKVSRRFADLLSVLRHLLRRQDQGNASSQGDVWQAALLNDPVNSIRYVTLALQSELGLAEAAASEHVSRIHGTQSTVVWQGSRAKAEVRVRALQSWHLNAVLQAEH